LPSSASGHIIGIHGALEERQYVMTRMREDVSTRMPRREKSRRLYDVPVE
jgi:hypothetical protein